LPVTLFDKEHHPELVVRAHAPRQRLILTVVLAVVVLVGLAAAYEFGQYRAGFNVVSAVKDRGRLDTSIRNLESSNTALQGRIIELQTMDAGHSREDQVNSRTIGDLQAQVARQTEELAFYRAVVSEGAPAIGVRIGTVRLSSTKPAGNFLVDVSLVRAGKTDGMTTGNITFTVDGQDAGGKAATLASQALAGGDGNLPYDFRYFQDLSQALALPAGFKPEHLTVEVSSTRKDVPPLTQTFPWSAVFTP
jgi:hypothetical protein